MDARIPVRFAARGDVPPAADQILLIIADEGEDGAPDRSGPDAKRGWGKVVRLAIPASSDAAQGAGCLCCGPRSPFVAAFSALFRARARGEIFFFRAMVADLPADRAAHLKAALVSDPYLAAYFVQSRQG